MPDHRFIAGLRRATVIMNANCGDSFDRTFANRVASELAREIAALEKVPDAVPWVQLPPQPCPLKETPSSCYRRDGEKAVIEAGIQGNLCKGCEVRVSVLEGGKP